MSDVQRVLIVGGGIAGMSLAIALSRKGIASEIVEADPDWRIYGAGITITGPTLRAFDALGLLDRIEARRLSATTPRESAMPMAASSSPSRVSGRPLGPRIPNGGGIMRPVLHRILSEATRALGRASAPRRHRRGDRAERAGRVRDVDRRQRMHRYDLVVGADGIHSRVRAHAVSRRARACA